MAQFFTKNIPSSKPREKTHFLHMKGHSNEKIKSEVEVISINMQMGLVISHIFIV